jgi:PAT family beta-lactamase induction signal transducer AmpG
MNVTAGYFVEMMGWTMFFLLCALLAIPGMVLLLKVAPWNVTNQNNNLGNPG